MNAPQLSFTLSSPQAAFLKELSTPQSGSHGTEIVFGEIAAVPPPSRLEFDVLATAEVAYQVITVIGTIGGAIQFIDWAVEKIRSARKRGDPSSVLISRGTGEGLISTRRTDDENRSVLNQVLLDDKKAK
jgi:hypothetical protein